MQPLTIIHGDEALPPSSAAWDADSDAPGLLAAGGELTSQRLHEAYSRGAFPWFSQGQPVLWWTPDPRMVLPTRAFKLSRSLRKTIQRFVRTPGHEIRFDSDFNAVIEACAHAPRDGQSGTWIVPPMIAAYRRWHAEGFVHSVEVWVEGELVGGLYAVNIGAMVYGESMFARRTDASKIALAALVAWCRAQGIELIDCQQNTAHLASLGAREITRADFEAHIAVATRQTMSAPWTYDSANWSTLGLTEAA